MGHLTVKDSSVVLPREDIQEFQKAKGPKETTETLPGPAQNGGFEVLQNEDLPSPGRVPKGVDVRNAIRDGAPLTAREKAALETAINAMPGTQASTAVDETDAKRLSPERREHLQLLLDAYYGDTLDHPKLHLVEDSLNLNAIGPVGRRDEVGRLRKVALTIPYALRGDWEFSPIAASGEKEINLSKALEEHASLTQFLLDRGVEVHLMIQPENATEAVYNTDIITAIHDFVAVSNPKHGARKLERGMYEGGARTEKFAGPDAPLEWGDFLLAQQGERLVVVQGYNSLRGSDESVKAMGKFLRYMQRKKPDFKFLHVPLELATVAPGQELGEPLHLDYSHGYVGEGDTRTLVIAPDAFPDGAKTTEQLKELYGAKHVIEVTYEQAQAGATNFSSLDPQTVLFYDDPGLAHIADAMEKIGLTVERRPFSESAKKDGRHHCVIGQLLRD